MTPVLLPIVATVLVAALAGCAAMKPDPSVAKPGWPPYHKIAGSVDSGGVIAGTGGGGSAGTNR
jgi:hypothetical protein